MFVPSLSWQKDRFLIGYEHGFNKKAFVFRTHHALRLVVRNSAARCQAVRGTLRRLDGSG